MADWAEVTVLEEGAWPHECVLPGWWQRRKLGLLPNAKVKCNECGRTWTFAKWGDGWAWRNDGLVAR